MKIPESTHIWIQVSWGRTQEHAFSTHSLRQGFSKCDTWTISSNSSSSPTNLLEIQILRFLILGPFPDLLRQKLWCEA